MVDITHKSNTLRIATAQAIVQVSKPETVIAIEEGTVPKGDVFSMAKAAGLLGVKKTWEMMPLARKRIPKRSPFLSLGMPFLCHLASVCASCP